MESSRFRVVDFVLQGTAATLSLAQIKESELHLFAVMLLDPRYQVEHDDGLVESCSRVLRRSEFSTVYLVEFFKGGRRVACVSAVCQGVMS